MAPNRHAPTMHQIIKLSVNLNKIALLRNQREVGYPSVLAAARTALDAGAQGITVHPRPDERHIRRDDVPELAALIAGDYGGAPEFNIEGYPSGDYMDLVTEVKPTQATLVPDAPEAVTSDHGWDIAASETMLREAIARIQGQGTRVSLFVDADPNSVHLAKAVGADRVELYTGPYAEAAETPNASTVLERYRQAGSTVQEVGLGLNAGHDLTRENLPALCAVLPNLAEVSIGHALTTDALWMGLEATVRAYLAILAEARTAAA